MRKLVLAALTAASFAAAVADEVNGVSVSTNRVRMTGRERRMMVTGGMVAKPGTGKGLIAVIDTQRRVPEKAVSGALRSIDRSVRFNITYRHGESVTRPTIEDVKKTGANVAIFVVDDAKSRTKVLLAPEELWAVVNVHALTMDSPSVGTLSDRTCKEIMRAFGWLCGAANSQMRESVMGPMPTYESMDKVLLYDYPFDLYQPTIRYMYGYGVQPRVETTYLHACQQGWAPQPTNQYQKAIWDKVHAMPKNPMKIEFDPKKGR